MLLNRFSFLFFAQGSRPEPTDLPGQPVYGTAPAAASIILVPGENYRVYIPFTTAPSLANTGVDIVSETGVLINGGMGAVQVLAGSAHRIVSVGLDPSNTLPEGYYRLRLNGTAGPILSNRVWVRRSNYADTSALFTWANTRAVGPIDYENPGLVFGFSQQLRLKCQAGIAQPDTSIEEYEQVTTGQKVPVSIKTHGALPFGCPNTDGFGHEGWRTLLAHRKILLNNQPVSVKTGYSVGDGIGTLASGSFELWDTEFSLLNRC